MRLACRYHHHVVETLLRLVFAVVVQCVLLHLPVHHGKHGVGRLTQRPVDRPPGTVGNGLGISLGAAEHHVDNLLRLVGDNLCKNLLLRVDELRLHLRTIAYCHVAYQVDGVALGIDAIGNLHHRSVTDILGYCRHLVLSAQTSGFLFKHLLGHGANGRHRCQHDVLHRTDVEVGIGTHHRRVAAGADVVVNDHRVREGLVALHIVHQFVYRDFFCLAAHDRTDSLARTGWRCHGGIDQIQFLSRVKPHGETGRQREIHRV